MSKYYNPKRTRNLYDADSKEPFRVSRSKIDLFMNCPKCFYLDRKLGIAQPPGFPFTLNSAVDKLLKTEFDAYRKKGKPHPLMTRAGLDAVPFNHPKIDEWRDALHRGAAYQFPGSNLIITGAVDDLWVTSADELIIVDYKATAKDTEVTIDEDWQIGYKRQMEIYQWLFKMNGFKVYPTGYFVYCNGNAGKEAFNNRLDFDIKLIPYQGDTFWVEPKIREIYACLQSSELPEGSDDCDFCKYRKAAGECLKNKALGGEVFN